MSTTKTARSESLQQVRRRVEFLGQHGLLTFQLPPDHTDEQLDLAHRIGLLDKRAYRELGFGTPAWENVIQLLVNAITLGVLAGKVSQGKDLLREATSVFDFYRNLTTRNRLLYLAGLLIGSVALAVLAATLGAQLDPEISARKVVLATVFAGLGSLASVLSRLTRIAELEEEHSLVNLFVSGASRPIVAAILAVIVCIILDLRLVTIQIGEQANADASLYLVASFLCGFSERFAKEILAKIFPQDSHRPSEFAERVKLSDG